jgi:hypothetical protein
MEVEVEGVLKDKWTLRGPAGSATPPFQGPAASRATREKPTPETGVNLLNGQF